MTDKSSFTPDEWALILESVMMSGMAVTAASPSGPVGMLQEGFASARSLAEAKMNEGSNPLIKAVAADFETSEGRGIARGALKKKLAGVAQASDIETRSIDTLRQMSALLDAKAPGDAAAFKGWLQQLSERVAEAAKEGGFLGMGGVPVNEAEKTTLAEISNVLKRAS